MSPTMLSAPARFMLGAGSPASFWSATSKSRGPFSLLLGLVANCPADSLSRLAETGRAFDQQAPYVLAVFALEPAE
jgi:hypothetical protein